MFEPNVVKARRGGWPRRSRRGAVALLLMTLTLVLLGAVTVRPLAAQQGSERGADRTWFPRHRLFEPLLADPNQPRYTAALISTDVFRHTSSPAERPPFQLPGTSGNDIEGAVGVGVSRAVVRLASWPDGGVDLGWMVGLFSRFRLAQPSRDAVGDDWFVGIPLTVRKGRLSARVRLLHHSSHMGDEIQQQGAKRIEYSWEGFDGLLAWRPSPHSRLYGGGTWAARTNSYTWVYYPSEGGYYPTMYTERFALQAGGETGWFPWDAGRAGLVAGIDWQAGDRADWRGQWSIVAGLSGHGDGYGGKLLARCFTGPSPMGEFFLTEEHYCGLEADVEF